MTTGQVYAGETVNIAYDNFTTTAGLELNGALIDENNAIRFDKSDGIGESVFTTDKISLGETLTFSTAFSFRNSTPITIPNAGTEGGFTFTLQSDRNSLTTSNFGDETINPSLSIAFIAKYMDPSPTTRLKEQPNNLLYASLGGFKLTAEPMTRCEISAVVYINGEPVDYPLTIATYNIPGETWKDYNMWIAYDGKKDTFTF